MLEQVIIIIMFSIAIGSDAFAVSVSLGASGLAKKLVDQLKIGFTFGFFQSGLFFLGILASLVLVNKFATINSIIAGILLAILGLKMIKDSFDKVEEKCEHDNCYHCKKNKCLNTGEYRFLSLKILLLYGTATSIDAFAAGVSFGLKNNGVILSTVLLGVVTFLFSFIGAAMGFHIKKFIGKKATIFGGIILILLAIKTIL